MPAKAQRKTPTAAARVTGEREIDIVRIRRKRESDRAEAAQFTHDDVLQQPDLAVEEMADAWKDDDRKAERPGPGERRLERDELVDVALDDDGDLCRHARQQGRADADAILPPARLG